jgi:hypothetical protein
MKASLKLVAALVMLAGLNGSNALAMQNKPQESVTYFYDDEAHTNVVGGTLAYCDGSYTHWGSRTLYSEEYYIGCG